MGTRSLCFVLIAACASGGPPSNNSGDDVPVADAPTTTHPDAPFTSGDAPIQAIDAPPPLDAFVQLDAPPPPVDAPSALFCTDNNMCTNPGECCITLGGPNGICGTGVIVFGACVPQ
jgi:hypothetical protein